MTIRDVLKNAFAFLFEMEEHMNQICDKMGEAGEEEMAAMMDELGTIQDLLMAHDFYIIDSKVEEVGRALGLADIGLDKDVTELSGGQRTKVLLGKLLLEKPDILLLDEPTNYLDVQHIDWLKRYLQEYENAFILISHDIPFLNSVINLIYHMETRGWTAMWAIMTSSRKYTRLRSPSWRPPISASSRKLRSWRISWPGTRPGWLPGTWPCPARKAG